MTVSYREKQIITVTHHIDYVLRTSNVNNHIYIFELDYVKSMWRLLMKEPYCPNHKLTNSNDVHVFILSLTKKAPILCKSNWLFLDIIKNILRSIAR